MHLIEDMHVTLGEVLEIRQQPLEERELWGILYKTIETIQDILFRGVGCQDGKPQYLVTPDNLLFTALGHIVLNICLPENVLSTKYWCSEMHKKEFCGKNLEKIYIFTIGQTICHAAHFGNEETNQRKLSPLIKTVMQCMCQKDFDLQMTFSDVMQVCLHSSQLMNGFNFCDVIINLYQEVIGNFLEVEQPNHAMLKNNKMNQITNIKNKAEEVEESKYNSKFYYNSQKFYHPEIFKPIQLQNPILKTPKERWKRAFSKITEEKRKSKWQNNSLDKNEAFSSLFQIYNEIDERKKLLELLRLSVNIESSSLMGLEPKSIAELILLLHGSSNTGSENNPISTTYMSVKSRKHLDNAYLTGLEKKNFAIKEPYYSIDKFVLTLPFKIETSDLKNFLGPEFLAGSLNPHSKITISNDKIENSFISSPIIVNVTLLNGEHLDIECYLSTSGKQLYHVVANHLNLHERYLFGLAYIKGNEYIFINRRQKISELLSPHSIKTTINLIFRVKFYLTDLHVIRARSLQYLYYLQLRKNFIDQDFLCDSNIAIILGGLALQAEIGNHDPIANNNYLLEHYMTYSCIKELGREIVKQKLIEQHINNHGISKELAQFKFLQEILKITEYGSHFHKVLIDKKNPSSFAWLAINSKGIDIYEDNANQRSLSHNYPWENIKKISFAKKYFYLVPRIEILIGKQIIYKFFTASFFMYV